MSSPNDYPRSKGKKKVKIPLEEDVVSGTVSWATDDVPYYLVLKMLAFPLCSFSFARVWF